MLSPGQTIANKLRIVRRVGEGGMGVVYEAVQLHLSRRVAIKVIHPNDATSPEARMRFRREAKAQAGLPLDYIVQVLDFDTLPDGSLYTVMEFLDGRDLKRELKKRGTLPVAEACAYVAQACRGAAVAHAAGIVHRDLKPRNIFVTNLDGERRVKLLDFGVAKFLEASGPDLTSASVVLGTPTHLAPEQIDNGASVDGRADVWALGVVLFELLTGQTPFRRETTLGTLAAVANDPVPPLTAQRPEVAPELVKIIERCLEKRPDARFQTADELGDALLPHALAFAGMVRPSQRVRRGSSAPPPAEATAPESLSRLPQSVPTVAVGGGLKIHIEPIPDLWKSISIPTEKVPSGFGTDAPPSLSASTPDAPPPSRFSRGVVAAAVLAAATLAVGAAFMRNDEPTRAPALPAARAPAWDDRKPARSPTPPVASLAPPPVGPASAMPSRSAARPALERRAAPKASTAARPAPSARGAAPAGRPAASTPAGLVDAVPLHL